MVGGIGVLDQNRLVNCENVGYKDVTWHAGAILHNWSTYCDVAFTTAQNIQNVSVANDVSPSSG